MRCCPKCGKEFADDVERCPIDGARLLIIPEVEDADLVGRIMDQRYEIVEVVDKGGMGVVYRARHLLLDRDVALKVMRTDYARDLPAIKRFFVEAKATSRLNHPNIVTMYDFGQTEDGLLYLSMEFLEGKSLGAIIEETGGLGVHVAVQVAEQVANALAEAHSQEILHRDLKPDNIFLIPKQDRMHVKVLDFGIARFTSEEGTRITKTGMICGTPHYISPEQAAGKPSSPASDLYSLGVILFEMLAGQPPYDDKTPISILMAHINHPIPSISSFNKRGDVPKTLESFILTALAKRPEHRPQAAMIFKDHMLRAARPSRGFDTAEITSPEVPDTEEGEVRRFETTLKGALPPVSPPAPLPEPKEELSLQAETEVTRPPTALPKRKELPSTLGAKPPAKAPAPEPMEDTREPPEDTEATEELDDELDLSSTGIGPLPSTGRWAWIGVGLLDPSR